MSGLVERADWDAFLARHPNAHLLQTAEWGDLKAEFGWETRRLIVGEAGAQVLLRPLAFGFRLAYIPKGPVGSDFGPLFGEIDRLCKAGRAIHLKLEPDEWAPDSGPLGGEPLPGFVSSPQSIQPPRTIALDITGEEDQILARMKQKTRYNIRLALRKGVVVRQSSDLAVFNDLMQTTGERDTFGVHSPAYYERVYELFQPLGLCELLIAEYDHQPLAALMVFARGSRAWYFYGASANEFRNYMPTYLLQWEAIRWARAQGCTEYDLWGVPDEDEAGLEEAFAARSDGLWGVYRFKRGFGGTVLRAAGPWDRVYNPLLYRLYNWQAASRGG